MEKGTAKRFTAKSVKNAYVLAWRMWFDIHYFKGVSRDHFSPPPKVDSAIIKITRKKEPVIPYKDYIAFLGLVEHALKKPQFSIDFALRGIFTPTQIKHLRKNLKVDKGTPVGTLSEGQWGIIFKTMIQYVPRFYWPRIKKRNLNRFLKRS